MKKTEIQKIREMSVEEQTARIDELKKELFNLRFQSAINQLENPMRLKAVKKEIAVIKTIMSEQKTENGAEA
ncbi:MAG: 50S ribosomal protein L29 [Clostridia bacterium]|nr:50S ribosomal protein L29 [Clostridia bacterium]